MSSGGAIVDVALDHLLVAVADHTLGDWEHGELVKALQTMTQCGERALAHAVQRAVARELRRMSSKSVATDRGAA